MHGRIYNYKTESLQFRQQPIAVITGAGYATVPFDNGLSYLFVSCFTNRTFQNQHSTMQEVVKKVRENIERRKKALHNL